MKIIDDTNFDEMIKSGVVVVDFFATWCGPCTAIAPVLDALSEKYKDKVTFYKLDVDQSGQTAARFGIMSIPNVIVFKNGQKMSEVLGAQPEMRYVEALEAILK